MGALRPYVKCLEGAGWVENISAWKKHEVIVKELVSYLGGYKEAIGSWTKCFDLSQHDSFSIKIIHYQQNKFRAQYIG